MGSTGKTTVGLSGSVPQSNNETSETQKVTIMDNDHMTPREQREYVAQLQQAMGQTGFEAGDPDAYPRNKLYVNTSKAFDINYYLNTGIVGSPNSDWARYLGYSERMINNDINRIDNGMKPLSESILGYRYIKPSTLGRILGIRLTSNDVDAIINNPTALSNLSSALKNTTYVNNGYSSLSYVKEHSTFDKYPIRFNVVARSGTQAIVTNNHREHEILVHRDAQHSFKGAHVETHYSTGNKRNMKYLVIDVEV